MPIITEHDLKLTNRNKNHWSKDTTTCSNNRMPIINFNVMKLSFYNNFCGTRYYESCLEKSSIFINVLTTQFSFQSQRKVMQKNAQTTTQLHSSHTLVK